MSQTLQQKMKGKFSFLDRFSNDKNKSTSEYEKTIAAIRNNEVDEVECNETFSDDNVAEICLAIQQSEHVTSFTIRNVSVEPCIEFLASLCSTTKRLQRLKLSNAGVNEHESNCLVAALLNNKSLKSLSLDNNNITNSEQWAQLLKINKVLESLDLSGNHLCTVKGSDGALEQFGQALIGNTKLRDLNLARNGFQESSVKKFIALIKEHGDEMGIRSTDLVNDASLSQGTRDALSSVMARPWVAQRDELGSRLGKPRVATAEAISPALSREALAEHEHSTSAKKITGNNNNNNIDTGNNGLDINNNNNSNQILSNYVNSQHQQQQQQQQHQDDDDSEISSLSNLSFTQEGTNNSNTNNKNINKPSSVTGGATANTDEQQQQSRAAKLQKLQQIKARHASELQQKERAERELRDQISKLESDVSRLQNELTTTKAQLTLTNNQKGADDHGPHDDKNNKNNNEQTIQQLNSIIEEMAKRHSDELEAKDQKLAMTKQMSDNKAEQLAAVVATLTAEHEQGELQISNIQRTMEHDKKEYEREISRIKSEYEQKEQDLRRNLDEEKQQYVQNALRLQEQFDAANNRADTLHDANTRLEQEASDQIESLQAQLAEALASATSPIAGFFDDAEEGCGGGAGQQHQQQQLLNNSSSGNLFNNTNNNNSFSSTTGTAYHQLHQQQTTTSIPPMPNQISTKVTRDAMVQTAPLPNYNNFPSGRGGGGATNSSSGQHQPPSVPSMDISSVTRFKMPESALATRPSSDDSFVPSDDEDNNNDEDVMRYPNGKPKYLPKEKWVPDEKVAKCMACKEDFGVFTRKHHCRACGGVFCDECSPVSKFEKVRICHMCASSQHSKLFM